MKLGCHLVLVVACASLGVAACSSEVALPQAAEVVAVAPPTTVDDRTVPQPEIGTPPERAEPMVFNATMTGREQVPTVYGTSATGTGTFTLAANRATLRYTVEHTLTTPSEAHLHLGVAGQAGEVLLPLTIEAGIINGTVSVTAAQAQAIEEGRAYVDVHSADYPDGEIRGQVVRPGEIVYVARLSADQVNPPTDAVSEGLGEILVDGTTNRMRFIVQVQGMGGAPTSATIGLGPAGTDGPTAVDLADPKTLPSPSFAGARTITSSQDLDLGRWYVQVASRRYPTGELRGQVLRPGQELYVGRLVGAESMVFTGTQAHGSVSVIVDANRDRIIYDVALIGMEPTAANLTDGVSGAPLMPLQVLGNTFRAMRMLTPNSPLIPALVAGNVTASAASAMFPAGEVAGQVRRVALPR